MTIVFVTTGAWGVGTGAPLAAAQVDGNFYDVDQRIAGLVDDLAEGKRIDTVTYASTSMTFHFTDGTSQIIPLPIATLTYVGPWLNATPYMRGQMVLANNGFYQVLQNHVSPVEPAAFDPNATDESTDPSPLYQLWMPVTDVNYDAAIFVPGSIQRAPDELLFQGVANRSMLLGAGSDGAYAHLDVAATAGADIILAIEKNDTEIGTITFDAGVQDGVFVIMETVNFDQGDRYALRVTQSDHAEAAGLSVTLPFVRTDI